MSADHLHISRKLLQKYDRPGPRYTSYPTVPEWTEEFTADDYVRALVDSSRLNRPLSLYFHIPFCRARCLFCGCNTFITRSQDRPENYLGLLAKEMDMTCRHLGERRSVSQMHWGGGTPTYLTVDQIKRLFSSIQKHFSFEPDAEIALEVDPRVTTDEQLETLRDLGFNRISMGVQDFDTAVQSAVRRNQSFEQTEKLYRKCRELGFSGINFDLIYGLPNQTIESFTKTVNEVIRLGADRVAVYSFAYLPTRMAHQRVIDKSALPDTETKFGLFAAAVEGFLDAGYEQIGMDHFARPDDELAKARLDGRLHRNFMGYTTKTTPDMIGIGMSAIGDLSGCFVQNIAKIDSYSTAIAAGKFAVHRGFRLSDDDKIRRQVILSIMCNFRLNFASIERQFDIDFKQYFSLEMEKMQTFIDDGLLEMDSSGISVLPRGWIFVRNVAMEFDPYLRKERKDKKPTFSRTI